MIEVEIGVGRSERLEEDRHEETEQLTLSSDVVSQPSVAIRPPAAAVGPGEILAALLHRPERQPVDSALSQ